MAEKIHTNVPEQPHIFFCSNILALFKFCRLLSRQSSIEQLDQSLSAATLKIQMDRQQTLLSNVSTRLLSSRNSRTSLTTLEPIPHIKRAMSVFDNKAPDLNPEGQLIHEETTAEGSVRTNR